MNVHERASDRASVVQCFVDSVHIEYVSVGVRKHEIIARLVAMTDSAASCDPRQIPADNAFEELVNIALEASAARSLESFDRNCAKVDLARLMIPGFHMFRFEFHVRTWIRAQLDNLQRPHLRIERDGRAFSIDDRVYDFSLKSMLRRVLVCLAEAATERPGQYVSSQEVLATVWPEQTEPTRAALSRTYVAINRLRVTTEVGGHIESTVDGYRMHPSLRIEWVDKVEL